MELCGYGLYELLQDILVIVEDVVCNVMQSEITSLVAVAMSEVRFTKHVCIVLMNIFSCCLYTHVRTHTHTHTHTRAHTHAHTHARTHTRAHTHTRTHTRTHTHTHALIKLICIHQVQQLYFACNQVGVGLIDDVIVTSCMEISQKAYAEESERIREQKYTHIVQSTVNINHSYFAERKEKSY